MKPFGIPQAAGLLVALAAVPGVIAFDGHQVKEGPLSLLIAPVPLVTNYHQPQPVRASVSNASAEALTVKLSMGGLVDECRAVGPTTVRLTVPPREVREAGFALAVGKGAYSALYPVRVKAEASVAGRRVELEAVRIFTNDFTQLPRVAAPPAALVVPASGAVPLSRHKPHRVVWQYFEQPPQRLPDEWTGTHESSGTSVFMGPVQRGETRQAWQVHPPWRKQAGTVEMGWKVRLPQSGARLVFYSAIRDHTASEPPSDGVTFRVWVDETEVYSRHTDSKTWVLNEVDLSRFRGREVMLRLETHPGPQRNTTCDSAFWGDPVILAGAAPQLRSAAARAQGQEEARMAVASGRGGREAMVFELGDGLRAAVVLGPNGLADAAIAFGGAEASVVWDGMAMQVLDLPVGGWPAGVVVERVTVASNGGRWRVTHRLQTVEGPGQLVAELWAEGPGLRMKIASDRRITDLTTGAADRPARRVYYGHGYCIEEPQAFRAGGGGHNLATSHVGFEFDNGLALLVATDAPVDYLEVNPATRTYALHTHPGAMFTFVPGRRGAMDCAIRYRPLYDKKAAPAVALKAGRFVFDLWGGRYAENTARLQRCFDYGLTNAMVIIHVWQRWGYDYRLPDIFPPLPTLGTLEELRAQSRLCRALGVQWGLHDNYIDIYPDCTDFSYENVTFTAEGQPRKAWLNEGRNAQSYQFRPDRVMPFLRRNMQLIGPALEPNTYFVDVWTSINAFDYFDRHGRFHSKMETLRHWGEAFNYIRRACGGGPTTSEAGSDQLIGYLDGADCQFLHLSASGGPFNNRVVCRDWARVPWFNAVNHTRFSLHGVGYPGRYEGGRGRTLHGITSDDYVSAEILTGNALMIDLRNTGREAIRKYWLAQGFVESVALDEIRQVEFAGDNPHRLIIHWQGGGRGYVNRGVEDWTVGGHVLPQFGYWAVNGAVESAIERVEGQIVERSRRPGEVYVNGRGYLPEAPLLIQPGFAGFSAVGERQFRLQVRWKAQQPAPRNLQVFYHFSRPVPGRYSPAEFYGGGVPSTPTTQWEGEVVTDFVVNIPENMQPGEYAALVGLFNAGGEGGRRYALLGDDASDHRYRVGKLIVSGSGGKITGLKFEPSAEEYRPDPRLLPNRRPVDFGAVKTSGAVKLAQVNGRRLIIPLPDGEDFEVSLRPEALGGAVNRAVRVVTVDRQGQRGATVPARVEEGRLQFRAQREVFGYELVDE
ncbi:MAG: hypothetical protein N3J91_14440 [Verrucomicrobiae bacterium]|nr:hypothetical protein [Verrucomicrobiae bacterium]